MKTDFTPTHTVFSVIDDIIEREGGFVNHHADRGGATKYGITIGTLATYWKGNGIDRKPTVDDVRDLPLSVAKDIYLLYYYHKPKLFLLPDGLMAHVMDCCVLHGQKRAFRLLQRAINYVGNENLVEDGKLGGLTRAACERVFANRPVLLNDRIVDERRIFMDAIVVQNPSQHVFIKGWRKRAELFRIMKKEIRA